jgi:hypothetical protein
MPIVEVNGQELEFPDDMSPDAIKGVLQSKFPKPDAMPQQNQVAAPDAEDQPSIGMGLLQKFGNSDFSKNVNKDVTDSVASGINNLSKFGSSEPAWKAESLAGKFLANAARPFVPAYGAVEIASAPAFAALNSLVSRPIEEATGSKELGMLAQLPAALIAPAVGRKLLPEIYNAGKAVAQSVPSIGESSKGVGTLFNAPLRGAGKVLSPATEEGLIDVATTAKRFNIPLSLDQISGNRTLKNVQKVSQEIPFSGQQSFRDNQMRAYNKALFKTVGVEADMFTPKSMSIAFNKVGGEFDAVTKGRTFGIGGDFIDNLASTASDVRSQYGEEAFNAFQREAAKVIDDFSGDAISGELISRQRSRINALARKASPGQKEALLDLENDIVDGITSGDPLVQNALSQAKQRYKNLIVLEPIANKAKGGMISPSLLNGRVSQVYKRAHTIGKSGDIGDLARVGSELLPELGGSDTAQKLMIMKAAAYPSAAIAGATVPGAAVPALAATGIGAGVNRIFQSGINRNQGLIDKSIMKAIGKLPPEEAKAALDRLRGAKINPN